VSSPKPSDRALRYLPAARTAMYGRCLRSAAVLARAVGDGSQACRTVDSRDTHRMPLALNHRALGNAYRKLKLLKEPIDIKYLWV